ncbi:unnamed protein product [Calypogeia fissa]
MGTAVGMRTETIREEAQQEEEGEWNYNLLHYRQPQGGEEKSGNGSTLTRTGLDITTEIVGLERQQEENYKSYQFQVHGENRWSSSSLTTATTKKIGEMCNDGGSDGIEAAVVAAPAEEWSPIRETPLPLPILPHHQTFDAFPAEEPGSSSDMDTDEDGAPGMREPGGGAAADGDVRAVAAHINVGFGAVAGSDGLLNSSGGSSSVAGKPDSKRKIHPDLGQHPIVEVTYEGLTRESKNILQQALRSWSYWHSRFYAAGTDAMEGVLQSGSEVYSPALALESSSDKGPLFVWMDNPLKKLKSKILNRQDGGVVDKERQDKESQDKEKDVPLYDRAYISALASQDLDNPDGFIYTEPEEGSRCFNCGSYTHSLRSCTRPHSATAIRNARDILLNKRGSRPRTPSRYYQCSPGGKFDDIKPGVLSIEARKAIGIGELDPPPWLNRMREIGYPPGYLDDADDESSGIQIFDDDTQAAAKKESSKDDNTVEKGTPVEESKAGKKMTVEYPGINAPIPERADKIMWAAPPEPQPFESRGCKRPYHQISQMQYSGSGMLSPQSPWAGGMSDADPREEGSVRSKFRGHAESYSRNRSDEVESQIDVYGSNLYCAASSVVNMNGILSVDPAIHWSKRRVSGTSSFAVEGTKYHDARSGMQAYHHYHHIPSSPSGLASPIRGMLRPPGTAEPLPSTSHIYSRHNHYHSQTQAAPLPNGQTQSPTPNPAWLKAQSALEAVQPSWNSGGLLSSPHRLPRGAPQNTRDPRVQHQWGRR